MYSRPKIVQLINAPAQNPLLFLFFFVIADFIKGFKGKENRVFPLFWFCIYLYLLWGTREERYMLPALPGMMLLAGFYLSVFRKWADEKVWKNVGTIIVIILLIAHVYWSVPFGRNVVLQDGALIMYPF
jgi:hypothetical protein